MKILLDTNILIHREASKVLNEEIGTLFNWMDQLGYEKCIHPLSIEELQKHKNPVVVQTMETKIKNYNTLKTEAPEDEVITKIRQEFDKSKNDEIDTSILKEVYAGRVSYLLTEDRKMHHKALELGVENRIFTIDSFLEKVISENPELSEYKVLSVQKEYFGNINLSDEFFDSFREDYDGFDNWFSRKSDEIAYICKSDTGKILAFLYIKIEGHDENYRDIEPTFEEKSRLKIGTFKVISNGYKLGERFLKIIFDNALNNNVDEVYVTLFDKSEEQNRLIGLLADWGFYHHGQKNTKTGSEQVYSKSFRVDPDSLPPKRAYPFISRNRRYFIVPIYPDYHTELLPDSILNNESPQDFIENEPHRNAIKKVYISRSFNRDLKAGDIIVFYRTGGYHKSVVTTLGIVDDVILDIADENSFINSCRKRSVFSDDQLKSHWNYSANRPFVVNFLYLYSFPKRPNLKSLIEMGVIANVQSAPRGFEEITSEQFNTILGATDTDESFIID